MILCLFSHPDLEIKGDFLVCLLRMEKPGWDGSGSPKMEVEQRAAGGTGRGMKGGAGAPASPPATGCSSRAASAWMELKQHHPLHKVTAKSKSRVCEKTKTSLFFHVFVVQKPPVVILFELLLSNV